MDAQVIDSRDMTTIVCYHDWPWFPDCNQYPDRYGCHRAQKAADELNEREAYTRFVVKPLVPRMGHRVKVYAYNAVRRGIVTEVKVARKRIRVRVRWYAKNGAVHEHWYDPREFRAAQQIVDRQHN